MDKSTSRKKEWELTEEAFYGLLEHLSGDRAQAAELYEEIRRKLIVFFEFRECLTPEEMADETINRVARRIGEGQTIHTPNIASYFYGVARNVLREYRKNESRESEVIKDRVYGMVTGKEPDELQADRTQRLQQERRLECLEGCLEALPADTRRMLLLYYRDEKGTQIKTRQMLAEELGIPAQALRLRMSRVRAKLEACINNCLKR
jgi:RNA polymerase sigma factor (sigma-70 family)